MDITEKKHIEKKAKSWYISNRHIYKKLSSKVESIITEVLDNKDISFHMITSRAKEIDSFAKKITDDKYDDPINQIHDLSGIRIITYVEDEVLKVAKAIQELFKIDKKNSSDKKTALGVDRVGYKSVHYVCSIKKDRIDLSEYKMFNNKVFEVQIRTILQHAWAEIEHDRNYKFSGKLPDELSRRFKLLSGTLELVDREFNLIANEIDILKSDVIKNVKEGNLNFDVNSTTLNQFFKIKLPELYKLRLDFESIETKAQVGIIQELNDFGIVTLQKFDNIIPSDFESNFIKYLNQIKPTVNGIFRSLMIINDSDKYFTKAYTKKWSVWASKEDKEWNDFFEKYGVNFIEIHNKYKVSLYDK